MGGVPLPDPSGDTRALIGRESELDELVSLLAVRTPDAAGTGPASTRAVVLAGDAGVGKTRLLTELRDVAFTEGWQVVAGHCLDFGDSALPYLPFSEVMGRLTTDFPELIESITAERPVLRALQPGRRTMQGAEQDASAAVGRADLFDAVLALFEAMAKVGSAAAGDRGRPLGRHLHPRPAQLPVLPALRRSGRHRRVVPLRRPAPAPSAAPRHRRVEPHPRHRPDAARAAASAGGALPGQAAAPGSPPGERRRRHRRPRRGQRVLRRGARRRGRHVPRSPRRPRRAAARPARAAERRPHSRSSARPRSPGDGSRTRCSPRSPASSDGGLDQALREAVELNVLVPTSNDFYRFRHALLAEAVYDDLLPGERVRMHAAYVDALASGRANGTAAELARHARVARDLVTAVDASVRAGDEAMAVGGPDEAADHYQTALELLSDPAAREEVPVDIGHARLAHRARPDRLGPPDARDLGVARAARRAAPTTGPSDQRARLLIAMANAVMVDENRLDPLEFTNAALELVSDEPTPLRAHPALGARARARVPQQRRAGPGVRRRGAHARRDPGPAADRHRRADHPGRSGRQGPRGRPRRVWRRRCAARPRPARTAPSCARATSSAVGTRTAPGSGRRRRASRRRRSGRSRSASRGRRSGSTAGCCRRRSPRSPVTSTRPCRLADVSGQAPPPVAETLLAGIVITVRAGTRRPVGDGAGAAGPPALAQGGLDPDHDRAGR